MDTQLWVIFRVNLTDFMVIVDPEFPGCFFLVWMSLTSFPSCDFLAEPISIELIGMNEVFDDKYWMKLPDYVADGLCPSNLAVGPIGSNILQTLKKYAEWRNIKNASGKVMILR